MKHNKKEKIKKNAGSSPQHLTFNSQILNSLILIVLIFIGILLYSIPLHSKEFYFDDHFSVENNQAIRTFDIPQIFNTFNTRTLVGLSFALNYKYCALDPSGYRLINILIHSLNALLIFLLIKNIFQLYALRKNIFYCPVEYPAFFGAMLFLCHPIQTEPVNFITQRFVLMGTFFYLLTLYLYTQYRSFSKKRYLHSSLASALAAMFCKEFVVTLPFIIALYEFYFLETRFESIGKILKNLIPYFIIVLIVPFLLLRTPQKAIIVANIAESNSMHHIDITRAKNALGRKEYFLTELNVVRTYVRLLLVPINQNLDYDYPISYHLDSRTLGSGFFLLCILSIALITFKTYRIISFGIFWFFIALSIESSFIPIGDVITEYRLYLPSIGFVFLMTSLIYFRKVDVKVLNIIAGIILIALSVMTYERNKIWQNEFTLWNDTVQKSPHKARPYDNRGFLYYNQGNIRQALNDFNKALALSPNYADAYNNRGNAYLKEGDLTKAMSDYNKTIQLNPDYALAYYNRGVVYYNQNNDTDALIDFNKSIELDPTYADAYIKSMSDYDEVIVLHPTDGRAYNNLAVVYYYLKDFDKAWEDVHKAQDLGYVVSPVLINLLKTAK